ncbi:MAG: NADPH-dependent FMN reductase [Oceanihabitans sp.]
MKNILAFAGSTSKHSINKKLVAYASSKINNVTVDLLDLNDYSLPLYSVDLEASIGFPENAKALIAKIKASDGIILSLAEHNGAYTAAFKNTFDWLSRMEQKTFQNKAMLLMATSPGTRGGKSVLDIALDRFPRHQANIVANFSLPSFYDNFKDGALVSETLNNVLTEKIALLEKAI